MNIRNFLEDYEPILYATVAIVAMFAMAVAFAPALRCGHEWVFANHSVREGLAAIVRGK